MKIEIVVVIRRILKLRHSFPLLILIDMSVPHLSQS